MKTPVLFLLLITLPLFCDGRPRGLGRNARELDQTKEGKGMMKKKPIQKKGCQEITATWLVRELRLNGALVNVPPPPGTFQQGDTLTAYADVCLGNCTPTVPPQPYPETFGKLWLKEALGGNARVPDGGYYFTDTGHQILFQGAIPEDVHEGPDGFTLGITGGTGKYKYATGEIFVNGPIGGPFIIDGAPKPTPSRVSVISVCGLVDA